MSGAIGGDRPVVVGLATPGVVSAEIYFLNTNAYAILLSGTPVDADRRLRSRLSDGTCVKAVISEITSLEIHSVIGQFSRGQSSGVHVCERTVESSLGVLRPCGQQWLQRGRKPLRPLEFERLRKVIKDAENGHGPIRLTVSALDALDFRVGKGYLYGHAKVCRVGSHDAVIAAAASRYNGGVGVRIVTSDSGLKSLLRLVSLRYYDPQNCRRLCQAQI